MTADESGLPPLDPTQLNSPEFNPSQAIVGWIVDTLLSLDIEDERREALRGIFRDIKYQELAKMLESELFEELMTNEIQDPDFEPPTKEAIDAFKKHIEELRQQPEGEPPA